jgi:peptidoglycan DL-endopeptidase CwlO
MKKSMARTIVRCGLVLLFVFASTTELRAVPGEGVFNSVKKWFSSAPTPAPTPTKKKKTTTTKKSSSSNSKTSASPRPKASHSPLPTPTPSAKPSPRSEAPEQSPSPSPTATPEETPQETPEPSDTSSPEPDETPPPVAVASPKAVSRPKSTPVPPSPSKSRTAPVSVPASEIAGYEKNPPAVRKVLDQALDLTNQNLSYKYGSADPAQGGMDCSGFIYYVLKHTGMSEVPRDAREQYIWVRKAGKFQAVLGRSPDTFELDALKPGDLLFWAGTYNVDRDPAITHTMIYLGRDKATNQRIMVGASDGRTYKGQSRYGVSVFDFKMAGRKAASPGEPGPVFVGYGSIPGLGEG